MPDVPQIALRDVTLAFDGRRVLDGVSVEATERRIGIVGRNGSGKTTLARVMAGLVAPDIGTVRVGGIDVARDRKAALGAVGILFQNPDHQIIFPTVEEEIAFGLAQQGRGAAAARDAAHAVLARFGRAHWARTAVHTLSQGQKQLVCLMAILAMAPRVVILDEPLSGLDIPTRMQLMRHLDAIPATVVHVSHDTDALAGCDRVLWVDDGRIARDGDAGEVLADFAADMHRIGEGDDIADLPG